MLPAVQRYFGDMAVVGILAHEYGHALSAMSGLWKNSTPGLVLEQQADCFAGVYLRWVAEGNSSRFTLSTGEGLTKVTAGLLKIADPILTPDTEEYVTEGHGTALDRSRAFQLGFDTGAKTCVEIDLDEIEKRRGDLPLALRADDAGDVETGQTELTEDIVRKLADVLNEVFSLQKPPELSFDSGECSDAKATKGASYCPSTNTIHVDLSTLQDMGKVGGEELTDPMMIQGDNTALSIVASRYALAVQNEKGQPLDSPITGIRTACLTGATQRHMAEPNDHLTLSAGDVDEALAGLIMNGLAASDVNGENMPAGFTRVLAFRTGVEGDVKTCDPRIL
jgi:predicted metalloprotease